jgi:pyruvate dehydrogenase E1 component alpha subunit
MLADEFDPLKGRMLQVLDNEGSVIAPALEPKLQPELLLRMHYAMLLSRLADERAIKLQRAGRMGTFAPSVGQEAIVGAAAALDPADWTVPSYRELPVHLFRGLPLEYIYLYFMGDARGNRIPETVRTLPIAVPVSTQVPHAVGFAWAAKIRGEKTVAMAFFGDGATSKGDFHEGLNFAGVLKAPVVFVCQNNQYAISVPREKQSASKTLAQKAVAYGFPGIQVDGNDALAMYAACAEAVARARSGNGPTLVEAYTYRMLMHTTADDPKRYRSESEEAEWREKDPIKRMRGYLRAKGVLDDAAENAMSEKALAEIESAVKKAEAIAPPEPSDLFDYIFAEPTPELAAQKAYLKKALAEHEIEEEHLEIKGGFP